MNPRLLFVAVPLLGASLLTSHAAAQTLTAITEWNFNNNAVAVNTSPATSTGTGTASTLGMNVNSSTGVVDGVTKDTSDVNTSTPLSSDPGTAGVNTQWRIRGGDGTASPGAGTNAWTSLAAIGSQGAQFAASTVGYTGIRLSFDWSPTSQGEAKLQVQYTLNGSTYLNVPINLVTSFGTGAAATGATNATSTSTVVGGYLIAGSTTAYMNAITLNLTTIAGATNNANFAVRLVNAATGTDDTSAASVIAGAPTTINNTSGNWRFDEVTISGTSLAVVPEPGTCALVCLGMAGVAAIAFRRRQAAV